MASDVTKLLLDWSKGEEKAMEQLLPIVYDELRKLAGSMLRGERNEHTLQPTALVHEAYLKLIDQADVQWDSRSQFFAFSAKIMRNILVDHARKKLTRKRGGGQRNISLEEVISQSADNSEELIALDEALTALADFDERKSRIIELRYFGGLSLKEIESIMKISPATIRRDMRFAEAWLFKNMNE